MKIAVAGGTGTVGVVQAATAAGFDVTSIRTTSDRESQQFFGAVTQQHRRRPLDHPASHPVPDRPCHHPVC